MEKFIKTLKKNKYIVVVLLLMLGILLVTFPNEKKVMNTDSQLTVDSDYIDSLETRLENIISTIEGAGECSVMINLSSTAESIYLEENKKSYDNDEVSKRGESEDSVLTMTDSEGNQYAVVRKKLMPKVTGAIITCEGGNDTNVKSQVTYAVCTVLGISSNNVCVIAKS